MPKQINTLDDMQLRKWVSKGKPLAKSDGDGLTFTLSKAGTAAWILRYRIGGKRRRELTIGNYPDISLATARRLARAFRAEIDGGGDPATAKKAKKVRSVAAWTVADLIDDYLEKKCVPEVMAASTAYCRKQDFKNVVRPRLGSLEVTAVTAADVVYILEHNVKTWRMAERTLAGISQLFHHAVGRRIITANPCAGISLRALLGPRPEPRKRVMLTEAELHEILSKLDDVIGRQYALGFRCLLGTCVRSAELIQAKWADVDFDNSRWWVRPEHVKTRRGMMVPLAPPVREWFLELKELSNGSDFVLPGQYVRDGSHMGRKTLSYVLDKAQKTKAFDVRHFTPHDTRSTAKGHMRNLGVSREVSEVALNHSLGGLDEIYDVREESPELRAALDLWAACLVACENGTWWHVVPFAKAG